MHRLPPAIERALQQLKAYQAEVASDFTRKVLSEGMVTCRKGCSHCCHYPLYITVLEGMAVYRWLVENRRWTHALQERLRTSEGQTWGLSVEVWLLSSTLCPLLGDDKLCQGYPCRPTACRTVYSRGDPALCHPHKFSEAPLVPRKDAMAAWASLEQDLLKSPLAFLPFSTAVLLAERVCKGDIDLQDCNPFGVGTLRKW